MTAELAPGWPIANTLVDGNASNIRQADWTQQGEFWRPSHYEVLSVPVPAINQAEFVGKKFCGTCHETYVEAFMKNVHGELECERCHGAASLHVGAQGRKAGLILSFRKPDVGTKAGRLLSAAERSELCLQCHEECKPDTKAPCIPASTWRTSGHAHEGVSCTDCHRAHYLVPLGTPPVDEVSEANPYEKRPLAELVQHEVSFVKPGPRGMSRKLGADSPQLCYKCHTEMRRFEEVDHPHQMGVPFNFRCTTCHDPPPVGTPHSVENHPQQFNCTTCHDAHGGVRAEMRKDLCLKCHSGSHMNQWHLSPHDAAGVACTDCHNPHPAAGLPMSVDQPTACYRCHSKMRDLEAIAHPHQILGPNDFLCTTCHDPHGKVVAETKTDLCLRCHDGAPTMAWLSSTHHREGVACTDCHNPHPDPHVQKVVNIRHTNIRRPNRLPMSVQEPEACYKCHPKIYGRSNLPSHHPIREGKMVCSDCHDGHGQAKGNLNEDTVNQVCYNCHAEKTGPFAYEHPPATEDCGHCHNPHGTVANNLLHQPTTFLCLRCHSGHSTHGRSEQCLRCHFVGDDITNVGGGPRDLPVPTTPTIRKALFTDCTQCHTQVHGGDLPSGFTHGSMLRR